MHVPESYVSRKDSDRRHARPGWHRGTAGRKWSVSQSENTSRGDTLLLGTRVKILISRVLVKLNSTLSGLRKISVSLAVIVVFPAIVYSADANDVLDRKVSFNIAENTRLEDALIEWGTQAQVTVMINTSTVDWKRTQKLEGTFSAREALMRLLKGSGLSFSQDGERILIVPKDALVHSGPWALLETPEMSSFSDIPQNASADDVRTHEGESTSKSGQLNEVVVTAEKQTERLQDVPVPVTALESDALVQNSQVQLRDYYDSVPGLSIAPGAGTPATTLAIRGITTGANQNPTVGITVDDVPFGASTSSGTGGGLIPDLNPADLARIEVLRGPQGTLYGASSMGGLLKFVTTDPSTEGISGRVQAGASTIHDGPNAGYNVNGAINVPVTETVAVRATGFMDDVPGYVDDIETNQRGVNKEVSDGGHVSMLWKPADTFSLKLNAFLQEDHWYGDSSVFEGPGYGVLQQSIQAQAGHNDSNFQQYSAIVNGAVGRAQLTSITGYNVSTYQSAIDFTGPSQTTPGTEGALFINDNGTRKFTQEIRLAIPIGSQLDWLIGAFYTHEHSHFNQAVDVVYVDTGLPISTELGITSPSSYQEYAAFTDLTVHVTDRFDIQFGGRESRIDVIAGSVTESFFPGEAVTPEASAKANVFTYLVTPKFTFSNDWMVYARLASGYRPGGPNAASNVVGGPDSYSADKTNNYELGTKGEFWNNTLSVDASLYYIDWKRIQISVQDLTSTLYYTTNGNSAKSQGLELTIQERPLTGLTLSAWAAFADAELTQSFPATATAFGNAGDPLPYSSRFSGHISSEQDFPIRGRLSGFALGTVSYVGDRRGEFSSVASQERVDLPAYAKVDLQTGLRYDEWTINAYANNVADRRGALSAGLAASLSYAYQVIQPRTIGVNFVRTF